MRNEQLLASIYAFAAITEPGKTKLRFGTKRDAKRVFKLIEAALKRLPK